MAGTVGRPGAGRLFPDLPARATRLFFVKNAVLTPVDVKDRRRGIGGAGGSFCFQPRRRFRRPSSFGMQLTVLVGRPSRLSLAATRFFLRGCAR